MKLNQILTVKIIHNKYFYISLFFIIIFIITIFVLPKYLPATFISLDNGQISIASTSTSITTTETQVIFEKIATHQNTPEAVKGIYMTACVAGTPSFRAKLIKLIDETELNSVVIDIKDSTGTISFAIDDPLFKDIVGTGCRVGDMMDFINTLHDKNIYVIGRIAAFQDPLMTKINPEWAVKKLSDKNAIWKDRKGLSFVDAGNKDMWQYLVDLAKASYKAGFDEINFDYIRFPSDGDMKDIYYPWSEEIWMKSKLASSTAVVSKMSDKALVMESFFKFLHNELKDTGLKLSVDFFGMTTTNYDDLGIGQVFETAIPYFDYICPMVYPSHYPPGFMGFKSVAEVNAHPYEIVKFSMDSAVRRLKAFLNPVDMTAVSSTTAENLQSNTITDNISIEINNKNYDPAKIRPWLQDNDYPVLYTAAMVRAQIQATYDAGLTSWLLWDAGNTYTQAALLVE